MNKIKVDAIENRRPMSSFPKYVYMSIPEREAVCKTLKAARKYYCAISEICYCLEEREDLAKALDAFSFEEEDEQASLY